MKLIVLTSLRCGAASLCLPTLCRNSVLKVVGVVLAHGVSPNRARRLKRRLKKILYIGLFGALNGIRLREWYRYRNTDDIHNVCASLDVPLFETDFINCENTKRLFKEADADLGLSLGCGYIGRSVFGIPKHGIINIHTEVLPRFRSQSIIWPIYEGVQETGFTIHQVDCRLDTGDILFQKKYPIVFYPSLRETVERNLKTARDQLPEAFSYVCENYERLAATATKQEGGKYYTTPTLRQFMRMVRNHKRMYRQVCASQGMAPQEDSLKHE